MPQLFLAAALNFPSNMALMGGSMLMNAYTPELCEIINCTASNTDLKYLCIGTGACLTITYVIKKFTYLDPKDEEARILEECKKIEASTEKAFRGITESLNEFILLKLAINPS